MARGRQAGPAGPGISRSRGVSRPSSAGFGEARVYPRPPGGDGDAPGGRGQAGCPSGFGFAKASIPAIGVLALLLFLVAGLMVPSRVVGSETSLEVLRVGWDGAIVPGTWTPVRVRVTGGDADLNARVEVVMKARYQTGPQSPTVEYPVGAYGQEMALPAGAAKEVTLWAMGDGNPGAGMSGSARLLVGREVLAEQKIEFKAAKTPYWPLVGVLADNPSVYRALSQIELPVQGLPVALTAARLAPVDLPTDAERLRAFNALVVQGNAAATANGEQRRAVQEWVVGGGHLLVAGGPEGARAASLLPPTVLPVTFTGVDSAADLSGLAEWAGVREEILASGPVALFSGAGGSVLAGAADHPLAWRVSLGRGTVTVLAADPGLEPLAGWSGAPALLRKALEAALPNSNENEKMLYIRAQEQDLAARIAGAAEALPPEAFPDWQTVALILGGFALLVGPLGHLLLWRANRRGWVWLVVPTAAVLLSGALYYMGVGQGGRDVLVNVVAHLRLDPDAGQAKQSVVAGFYAPTHAELAVQVPGDAPVRAIARNSGPAYGFGGMVPGSVPVEPPFCVIGGRDTRIEFDSGRWAMRSVALSRILGSETGRISAHLGLESGLIKGTIQNDTPYPLEDAAVTVGQNLVKLGSLAPGQSAPVVLDPVVAANPFGPRWPPSLLLFGRPRGSGSGGGPAAPYVSVAVPAGVSSVSVRAMPGVPGGMPEQLEMPSDPEVQRRSRLLEAVNNFSYGPTGPTMPFSFVAFTRAKVGGELPEAGAHPTYYLTLLEQPLRLDLPPGPFILPPALSPVELTEQTGGFGGGSSGTISWVQLNGGSATYSFRPPLPPKAKADALVITTQQIGSAAAMGPARPPHPDAVPGPAEEGIFSVYNWESAAWDPLPAGREQARLEPASPYLGPEDTVKVRVNAGADRVVSIIQPELTVEGRVE